MMEFLTAETEEGRSSLAEVMDHSYHCDLAEVPAHWARVLVVDGVPVSFIMVDPARQMEYRYSDLPYAFICDVATRTDLRGRGYFKTIMQHTFDALHQAGLSLVVTHGRHQLYRRFGFDVFTHHCGIFITPCQIEQHLGKSKSPSLYPGMSIQMDFPLQPYLLYISDIHAVTLADCRELLLSAGRLAMEHGKTQILLEHPASPSYGSRYPIYVSLHTRLTALTRACGADVRIQPADPEAGTIPDADWIKVLDPYRFMHSAIQAVPYRWHGCWTVEFQTELGNVVLDASQEGLRVSAGRGDGSATTIPCPAVMLAQMVTGYRSIDELLIGCVTSVPSTIRTMLNALFPRCWRLSRNESWLYLR